MPRFDFTGYIERRDEALEREAQAERARQQALHDTWVELKREAGNYVQRNGGACQVSGAYPTIDLDSLAGKRLVVTVQNRSAFHLSYNGESPTSVIDEGQMTQVASGDEAVTKAIVEWYESVTKRRV